MSSFFYSFIIGHYAKYHTGILKVHSMSETTWYVALCISSHMVCILNHTAYILGFTMYFNPISRHLEPEFILKLCSIVSTFPPAYIPNYILLIVSSHTIWDFKPKFTLQAFMIEQEHLLFEIITVPHGHNYCLLFCAKLPACICMNCEPLIWQILLCHSLFNI